MTSLLNRAESRKEGVILTPTYSFDERGHTPNQRSYFVFGITEDGKSAEAVCADLDRYTGEGSLIMPEWVAKELPGDSLVVKRQEKKQLVRCVSRRRSYAREKSGNTIFLWVQRKIRQLRSKLPPSGFPVQNPDFLEETKLWWDQVNQSAPIRVIQTLTIFCAGSEFSQRCVEFMAARSCLITITERADEAGVTCGRILWDCF